MPPLIAHCSPGVRRRSPAFGVIVSSKRRSKSSCASNGVGAGRPYVERIEVGTGRFLGRRGRAVGAECERGVRPLERKAHRRPSASRTRRRSVLPPRASIDLFSIETRPVQIRPVDRNDTERRSRQRHRLTEAVGVDEPKADAWSRLDGSPRDLVPAVQRRDAVEGVHRDARGRPSRPVRRAARSRARRTARA